MKSGPPAGGYLAVLLGPDGAGKTSLTVRMRALAPEWRFPSLQPEDLYPLEGLEGYNAWALNTHPREYVMHMAPLTRISYFLHIIAIEWEYHIRPALAENRVVVCDSYWYRAAVKELIQNPTAAPLLSGLTSMLPKPDLIAWLDLPLAEAWRRTEVPTVFEVADGNLTWDGFQSFQRRVNAGLRAEVAGIPQVSLDATRDPDDVARIAVDHIGSLAAGCVGADTAVTLRSGR
jgi:thymidylate kinase